MRSSGWLGAMAVAMVACTGAEPPNEQPGGQFGEEAGAHCVVLTETPLALDEISPLGFSAQELLALAAGASEHELDWVQLGQTTSLSLAVTSLDSASYVEQGVERDEGYGGPEPWCPNVVKVAVRLELSTEDGALAESAETALTSEGADRVSLTLPLDAVAGSFDPWDHVPAGTDFDEVRAWLELNFDASGLSGRIDGQGSGVVGDPNDPDSVAYAQGFDIATFGDTEEE